MPLKCPDFSLSICSFYLREFWIRKNNVSSLLELNRSLNRIDLYFATNAFGTLSPF